MRKKRADPIIERAFNRCFKDNDKQQNGRLYFIVGKDIKDHFEGSKVTKRLKMIEINFILWTNKRISI